MIPILHKPGRYLGMHPSDLANKPYAQYWNPKPAALSQQATAALTRGPVAPSLLPSLEKSAEIFKRPGEYLENGFCLTVNGAMHVTTVIDFPDATPMMFDWWFGWHSDEPQRYKLWHPEAHVHAEWLKKPPLGATGRDAYIGRVSIVDEYLGSTLGRYAIQFQPPEKFGLDAAELKSKNQATAICARIGFGDFPIDAGYLIHYVRRTASGSRMYCRFWLGGPYVAARRGGSIGRVAARLAALVARPSEADARALFVHCNEEMPHLATFLPQIFAEFNNDNA